MSRQRDRDEFIALMAMEGVGVDVARKLIRAGATLHWLAERACSSEAADRDRIPCPGERRSAECLCEHWSGCGCPETAAGALVGAGHHKVTRISVHGPGEPTENLAAGAGGSGAGQRQRVCEVLAGGDSPDCWLAAGSRVRVAASHAAQEVSRVASRPCVR